jgi:hypothetical protein
MKHFANFYSTHTEQYLEYLKDRAGLQDFTPEDLYSQAKSKIQGFVNKYPASEVGYASTKYGGSLGNRFFEKALEPKGDAISTPIPIDKIGERFSFEPKENQVYQLGHTHPTILSAKAAGANGSDWDISNMPKYPSLGDLTTQDQVKNIYGVNGAKILPSLISTKEYGEPVDYKYDTIRGEGNIYSRINQFFDAARLAKQDQEIYDYTDPNNVTINPKSDSFLRRAALEEEISNENPNDFFNKPWMSVQRNGSPIPDKLPNVGRSYAGQIVAGANTVGLVHGGYTLKKAYDERRRQKQADDVQLTNKYQ